MEEKKLQEIPNLKSKKGLKIPVIEVPKYSLEDELKEQEELNNFISKPLENDEALPYDDLEKKVK